MENELKKLSIQLQTKIQNVVSEFMLEKLTHDEENTSDILNLILSAALSPCFAIMRVLASEHKQIEEKTNKLIEDILQFMTDNQNILAVTFDCEKEKA